MTESAAENGAARILVADDQDVVRGFVSMVLRGHGYDVVDTASGDDALDLCDRGFDLLIADLVMPPEGGLALAETLRQRIPGLRVLFISGYGALQSGSTSLDPVLGKPFSGAELLQRVAELVP
jgi:CheY-like chemotaxis protein